MPRKFESLEDRLIWNSVVAEDPQQSYNGTPCWIWIGQYRNGYPRVSQRYKAGKRKGKVGNFGAHRLSIEVFNGKKLSPRKVAMHLCNNKTCINPLHLAGGTQSENIQQCVADGRHFTHFRKRAADIVTLPLPAPVEEDL